LPSIVVIYFTSLIPDWVKREKIASITPIPRVPNLLTVGTKVIVFEEWLDKLQE
jgi:hypothetical protein